MKILFVNNFGTIHGGAEVIIAQLRRGLVARGHEVKILAGDEPGNGEKIANYYFKTFVGNSFLRFFYLFNPFAIIELWRILRQYRPDIIHLHNISKASPFILPLLKKYAVVLTIHDHMVFDPTRIYDMPLLNSHKKSFGNYFIDRYSIRYFLEKLRFFFFRRFAKYFDVVFASSDFYGQCAKDSGIFKNIKTVHNGINLLEQSPIENWDNLLFAGRLEESKGAHVFLESVVKIKLEHPNIRIIIAGTGTQSDSLKQKTENLGIDEIVDFKGYSSFDKIKEFYRQSTVVIVPSLYPDNLPTVCIEAMAVGRPVVGSQIGGIPELIIDGKTGILFSPGNSDEMARRINELLRNKQLIKNMGNYGRIKAEKDFSADIFVEKIIYEYLSLKGK